MSFKKVRGNWRWWVCLPILLSFRAYFVACRSLLPIVSKLGNKLWDWIDGAAKK